MSGDQGWQRREFITSRSFGGSEVHTKRCSLGSTKEFIRKKGDNFGPGEGKIKALAQEWHWLGQSPHREVRVVDWHMAPPRQQVAPGGGRWRACDSQHTSKDRRQMCHAISPTSGRESEACALMTCDSGEDNMWKMTERFFLLSVSLLILQGVCVAEETSVSVTEGDSVVLHSDLTETLSDPYMQWMFGDQETRIAEIYRKKPPEYRSEGQFRDRLMMDSKTGSLTIRNITTEDAGLYKLQVTSGKTSYKTFNVSVQPRLPAPISLSDRNSSISFPLENDGVNNSYISVSDRKSSISFSLENDGVNNSYISVSDRNSSISFPLENDIVNNSYTSVLNNTINDSHPPQNGSDEASGRRNRMVSLAILSVIVIVILLLIFFYLLLCWRRKSVTREVENNIPLPSRTTEKPTPIHKETVV